MVYRQEAGGHLHVLAGSRASLRLVRELDRTGRIPAESLERAFEALRDFRSVARGSGVKRITAAGTSALRDASNGPAFLRRVRRELGITMRTLSGLEEARYGFLGAVGGLPVEDGALFDLGGGSLQVARFREPAAPGGLQRAARRSARLGRVPEVGPAHAARGPPAPRARAGDARRGGGRGPVGTRAPGGDGRDASEPGEDRPEGVRLPDPASARVRPVPAAGARDRGLPVRGAAQEACWGCRG